VSKCVSKCVYVLPPSVWNLRPRWPQLRRRFCKGTINIIIGPILVFEPHLSFFPFHPSFQPPPPLEVRFPNAVSIPPTSTAIANI